MTAAHLLLSLLASPALSSDDVPAPWDAVLGAPRGELPAPQDEIVWRLDLDAALEESRATGRPLFVTLRCIPCKQCAGFDQSVLEGGAELDPLLAQFITVRLTNAAGLDLSLFPVEGFQDLDLSWWGWFLSPERRVYGVFGGRDEESDATRISPAALAATLARVLAHHADPRRAEWDVDGPLPAAPLRPETLPGYSGWQARTPESEEQQCLHCHQVRDVLHQGAIEDGSFDKEVALAPWPYPENVGLSVERDDGLRVTAVAADGAAARLGLRVGDELAVAGGRRLFGQADLRGVLHRAPFGAARVPLIWRRGDALRAGELELEPGWKATDLGWRMSVSQGVIGAHPGFFPLAERARARHGIGPDTLAVRPFFGKRPSGPAWDAGLRPGHVILAVDGESPDLAGRPFLVWFRRRFEPGDTVRLSVLEGEGRRTLEFEAGR